LKPLLGDPVYIRGLELFAVIHEEIGEAQKAFNDFFWKSRGPANDIIFELDQLESPVNELKELIKNAYRRKP